MSDFARMGLLAGESIAAVRGEKQEFQRSLQTQAEQATAERQLIGIAATQRQQEFAAETQFISSALQEQAAADRQSIALANQREMQEFNASMVTQSQQRSQAWEFEKIEMSARNRFELQEQAYAIEFQANEADKIRITQETRQKISAINKARGDIGDTTADALILSLETEMSQIAGAALRPTDPAREAVARALSGDPSRPATNLPQQESLEVFETANQLLTMRKGQDPETQGEIDQILRGRNPQTMRRAIETLEGGGTKSVSISEDANFLRTQISSGQHSAVTNSIMQEAVNRGDPGEMKAVIAAVRSIEEDERRSESLGRAAAAFPSRRVGF